MNRSVRILFIISIIIAVISSIISVYATSYVYDSADVSYENSTSKLEANDVEAAINELYDITDDSAELDTKVTALETNMPNASSTTPIVDGTAAIGSSTDYARADHVHPSDTSKANLASPALTGTPTAPTAAAGTSTTQLATTAFTSTAITNATSSIGTFQNLSSFSKVTVKTSTYTTLGSITLQPGVWFVTGVGEFDSNATGRRHVLFSTSNGGGAVGSRWHGRSMACNGTTTIVRATFGPVYLTSSATYYLNAWQNSGGNLGVTGRIRAVRIK